MRHSRDHAPNFGSIGQRVARPDLAETERAQGAALLRLDTDARTNERDAKFGHQCTSTGLCSPRWRSLYAFSIPAGTNSAADNPRSAATFSGRRRLRSPSSVARATLIAFDEPSDFASTSC